MTLSEALGELMSTLDKQTQIGLLGAHTEAWRKVRSALGVKGGFWTAEEYQNVFAQVLGEDSI